MEVSNDTQINSGCMSGVARNRRRVYANNKEQKRLENSGVVMQEIMNIPDNIPHDVMEKAECVIVFPSVLKAAFVVGASYGRGAMVCRTGKEFHGTVGRASDDGAGRRQRWLPDRRTSH